MSEHLLLICTVGGSHEPIVQSILNAAPARVIFLQSSASKDTVDKAIQELTDYERPLNAGAIARRTLSDEQSLLPCIVEMRKLTHDVREWTERGDSYDVMVDFTAGTKIMSAALALVAHRWPCRFVYVGGTQRDKNGLGIVQSGSEKIIKSENPWDALAYQPLEDTIHLFNHRQPAAAVTLLDTVAKRSDLDPAVKRQIVAVKHLADAYAKWDAFRHNDAVSSFNNTLNAANDLDVALPDHGLKPALTAHRDLCKKLADDAGYPSRNLILDLLANADRRADDGRFDDAVARLYRATEALAQLALLNNHQINAADCPMNKLPQPLRDQWASRTNNGSIKLALQDAYTLLAELGHDLGKKFRELQLDKQPSPLSARNQSILAHGFAPTTKDAFNALRGRIHQLAGSLDLQPFTFPKLPNP